MRADLNMGRHGGGKGAEGTDEGEGKVEEADVNRARASRAKMKRGKGAGGEDDGGGGARVACGSWRVCGRSLRRRRRRGRKEVKFLFTVVIGGAMACEASTIGCRTLSYQGVEVSSQGLGCMGMSFFYGTPKPEPEMISLIHHVVRSGVTFLDTSDIYGPFTNESLIGKALGEGWREKVQVATKFGIKKVGDGHMEVHGDPAYVRAACEGSLKRLGVESIDLYYQHRVDTNVPIEVTVPMTNHSWFYLI